MNISWCRCRHLHSNNLLGMLTLFELIERNGASPIEETFFLMCYLVLIGPLFLLVVTPFLTHKIQALSSYVVFFNWEIWSKHSCVFVWLCLQLYSMKTASVLFFRIQSSLERIWFSLLQLPMALFILALCPIHERRHMSVPYCENKSCKSTGVKWKKQAASHAARQTIIKKKKFRIFFASPKSEGQ